jgi:pimeloyl-ACP methyl ester carboxylesterase
LWSAFDSLRCPTLIVRGNDSDLLSEQTLSQMLSRNKNAQAVRMIGVGHAPTLMATDQVRCIEGFLSSP